MTKRPVWQLRIMIQNQKNLFMTSSAGKPPLADKVRPKRLADFIGQKKVLAPGMPLRTMIEEDTLTSTILWGPPGSGKTTLAHIIKGRTKAHFVSFSAVLSGIKEVRNVMHQAGLATRRQQSHTIVFIDEIHRFNKAQQDAFLPFVESGAVVLLGATTENPSFEVIPALLSRCHVFVLMPLGPVEMAAVVRRAHNRSGHSQNLTDAAVGSLVRHSGADARRALNLLEMIYQQYPETPIDKQQVEATVSHGPLQYDKKGEAHFNLISALHKALRGSDAQAGLYWLARMLASGEDPRYIARRLLRFASEDVGLADPQALAQAVAAKEAVMFLGMPEANTALAQLVVYLATSPKSNSLYTAYAKAAQDARKTGHLPVPLHIRNPVTTLMKQLDYGKEYAYDHDFPMHYHYQKYFPADMEEQAYYRPSAFGFEKEIKKRMEWYKKLRDKQEAQGGK